MESEAFFFGLADDAGKTQIVQERLGREIRAQATSDEVRRMRKVECFKYLYYTVYEAKRRSKAHRGGAKLQVEVGSKTKAWDDITRHGATAGRNQVMATLLDVMDFARREGQVQRE